ncbi:MAG: DUF2961 domain-containing protein [Candidatus Hydrogenedentes bacterium]|nr:DUF2961 domain-containing protein [Candidatus Hydrogenedentota bacterium]
MELFEVPPTHESRWISFENPSGAKGAGATSNQGGKGAAFEELAAGETRTLMDYAGCGTVRRMWLTCSPFRAPKDLKSREMFRMLRLRMYWDGAEKPAVDVPLGDFVGAVLGEATTFESALIAAPEGRSANLYFAMPFRSHAKVTVTNESDRRLSHFYYDIDLTLEPAQPEHMTYFHAHWHRIPKTALREDFELLPRVEGRGRYLGVHVGVIANPDYTGWWGEGEVKMYLDGDTAQPTIVGTGTEDYIGTGWGQGVYHNAYQGALVTDNDRGHYSFYRYHIPDPVYFQKDIRVTLQQIGGDMKGAVIKMLDKGVELLPVSINDENGFTRLLDGDTPLDIRKDKLPTGWTNFYRRDDMSALAFFYLDQPSSALPELAPVTDRAAGLTDAREKEKEKKLEQ